MVMAVPATWIVRTAWTEDPWTVARTVMVRACGSLVDSMATALPEASVRALLICRVAPGSSVVKSTFWFASARLPRSLTIAVIVAAELPAESRSLVSDSSVSDCAWLPPRSPPPPAPAPEPPQAARVRNISRAVSQAAIDRGLWPAVVVVMVAIRVWGGSPRLARECRIRDHPWRDEHEQFGPVVGPGIVLEGVADDREVAEERHLVGLVAFD